MVSGTKISAVSSAKDKITDVVNDAAAKGSIDAKLDFFRQEICERTDYDHAAPGVKHYGDPWQLIYVFDGDPSTKVVCEGYAKAFQYLCDLTFASVPGVDCYSVTGDMIGGTGAGAHMWNVVSINGNRYLVDITNCDAGTIGADDKLFMRLDDENCSTSDGGKTYVLTDPSITYAYDDDMQDLYCSGWPTLATRPSEVTISGVTAPVAGESPDTSATGTEHTTVGAVQWYQGETPHSGSFGASTVYTAWITVTPDSKYLFGRTVPTFKVAGATVSASLQADGSYLLKATFPATGELSLPALSGSVSIDGVCTVGETLTANTTALVAESGASLSYQWLRDGVEISGAVGNTYTLTAADVGKPISLRVSSDKNSGSVTSAPVGPVVKKTAAAPAVPTVQGDPSSTSITVAAIPGAEYAISTDHAAPVSALDWQNGNSFSGLTANTTYYVYARYPETADTKASDSSVSAGIKTAKVPGTISISEPGTITYDGSAVTAGKGSGYDLSYGYNDDGVVTIKWYKEGAELLTAPTDAGNYQIGISAAAGSGYGPVAEVKKSFTISPKSIEDAAITLGSVPTYDGTEKTIAISSVTVDGLTLTLGTDYEIISGNKATNVEANQAQIRGIGNYTGQKTSPAWMLNKATLMAADFDIPALSPVTYSGSPVTLAVPTLVTPKTGAGSITVKYDGSATAPTNAGTYTVTFDAAGGQNFEAATGLPYGSLTINKVAVGDKTPEAVVVRSNQVNTDISVTLPPLEGDATYPAGGTVSDASFITAHSISGNTLTLSTANRPNGTSATITIPVAESSNHSAYKVVVEIVAKDKEDAQVTLAPVADKTYGDSDFTVSASVENPGSGSSTWTWTSSDPSVLEVSGSGANATVTVKKVGSATITAKYESDSTIGSATSAAVTVAKKALTLTYSGSISKEYDSTTTAPDVIYTGSGVGGETLTATFSGNSFADKDVGSDKAITLGSSVLSGADASNYEISYSPAQDSITGEITKKALTLTYSGSISKVYDGSDSAADVLYTGTGVGGETLTATFSGNSFADKDVGSGKAITLGSSVLSGADASNYEISYSPAQDSITGEISKKVVQLSISGPATATYGNSFEHSASATLLAGDSAAYTLYYDGSATKPSNAGTYTLTAALDNPNYQADSAFLGTTTFTISKANPLLTMATSKDVRFNDGADKTFAVSEISELPGAFAFVSRSGDDILSADPVVNGDGSLTYSLKSGLSAADADKTATVTLTFIPTDSSNYNAVSGITLIIRVSDKEVLTDVTVSLSGCTYGETLADPVVNTSATGGSATFSYQGTLGDGSTYGPTAVKPTEPGSYTLTATYENDSQRGNGSVSFEIGKKQLTFSGLSVEPKTYNGTTTATLSGTLALEGLVGSDAVSLPAFTLSANFDNAQVGEGKAVVLSGLPTSLAGADAWKYLLPAGYSLSGSIKAPSGLAATGEDGKRVENRDFDSTAADSLDSSVRATYPDAAAVKTALTNKAKESIPTIGSNISFYNPQVQVLSGVVWADATSADDMAKLLFPYPAGTSASNTDFVLVRLNPVSGDLETLPLAASAFGPYGISAGIASEASGPYALAWRVRSSGSATTKPDTWDDDWDDEDDWEERNDDFWSTVRKTVRKAQDGDTVKVNARSYDKMPWSVMQALRKNAGVTLVIRWNGGKTITILAGSALSDEPGRGYYPLSYLARKYKDLAPDKKNPVTGGVIQTVTAPDVSHENWKPALETEGINKEQAVLETTPLPKDGEQQVIVELPPVTAEACPPAAPASSSSADSGTNDGRLPLAIAVAGMVAALVGGFLLLKGRRER